MADQREHGASDPSENGKIPPVFGPTFLWPEAAVPLPEEAYPSPEYSSPEQAFPSAEGAGEDLYGTPEETPPQGPEHRPPPPGPAPETEIPSALEDWKTIFRTMAAEVGLPKTREDLLRITQARLEEGHVHMSRDGKLLTRPDEIVDRLVQDGSIFVGEIVTLPPTMQVDSGPDKPQTDPTQPH